jgi:hypothetical protein
MGTRTVRAHPLCATGELEGRASNLHHSSLRAKRGNLDPSAAGLPRFARSDDSHFVQSALGSEFSLTNPILFTKCANWDLRVDHARTDLRLTILVTGNIVTGNNSAFG